MSEDNISIKQIKDEVRKDKIKLFLRTYLIHIVIIFLVLCFVALGVMLNGINQNKKRQKYSDRIYSAMEEVIKNNRKEALITLQDIFEDRKAPKEIRMVSGMNLAGLYYDFKEQDKSLEIYKKIYQTEKKDILSKDLAGLMVVNILINKNDKNLYQEIDKLIEEQDKEKNPFRAMLLEQKALFEIQKGEKETAVKILEEILNNIANIDQETRNRIESLLSVYKN